MAKITHKGMWIELKSLDKDAKSKYILCNVFLFAGALLFGVHLAAVGGLGIEVSMESGVVKVISPIDDTPASRAGIKAGDYIVKINDTQVQGKTLSEAVDLMRGPVGSSIELTIRRRGEKKAITFNIVREVIQIQSVKAELLRKNIGYVRLTAFNENSRKKQN